MRRSELIVFALVICGPLMIAVFGFTTLYSFATPIQILLTATKRLKTGDLDFRVAGLKNEFAELAVAFNDMAVALRDRLKEITESERRYRLLFESAGDAIFILEAVGTGRAGSYPPTSPRRRCMAIRWKSSCRSLYRTSMLLPRLCSHSNGSNGC